MPSLMGKKRLHKKDLQLRIQELESEKEELEKKLGTWKRQCQDLRNSLNQQGQLVAQLTTVIERNGISLDGLRTPDSSTPMVPSMVSSSATIERDSQPPPVSPAATLESIRSDSVRSESGDFSQFDMPRLRRLCHQMRTELRVKDRKHNLKVYKECFIASDCVAWFLDRADKTGCEDESDAVKLGQAMVHHRLIKHVVRGFEEKKFKNAHRFFAFNHQRIDAIPIRQPATGAMSLPTHTSGVLSGSSTLPRMKSLTGSTTMVMELSDMSEDDSEEDDSKSERMDDSGLILDSTTAGSSSSSGDDETELPQMQPPPGLTQKHSELWSQMQIDSAKGEGGKKSRSPSLLSRSLISRKHCSLICVELHISSEKTMIDQWDRVEPTLMTTPRHKLTLYIQDLLSQMLQLKEDHTLESAKFARDLSAAKEKLLESNERCKQVEKEGELRLQKCKDAVEVEKLALERGAQEMRVEMEEKRSLINAMCFRLAVYKDTLSYFELVIYQKFVTLVNPSPHELLRETSQLDCNPNLFRSICEKLSTKKSSKSSRKERKPKSDAFGMFKSDSSLSVSNYCLMQLIKFPGTHELCFVLKQQTGDDALEFELFRRDFLSCKHVSRIQSRAATSTDLAISLMFEDRTLVIEANDYADNEEILGRCREILAQHCLLAERDEQSELEQTIDQVAPVTGALMGLTGAFT